MGWPFNPEPRHGELPPMPHGVPRPSELDVDYGSPTSDCVEQSSGVFRREYSRASVQLDCNAFEATIKRHNLA